MCGHRQRGGFWLFETRADSPSMLNDLARVVIQTRAEAREGFEFLELCVSQFEVARDRAVNTHSASAAVVESEPVGGS